MKRMITGIFAAAILAASPAWADNDHGHGHGKHAEKEWKKEQKHREKEWRKAERHAWKERDVQYFEPAPRIVERHYHYVEPVPVYAAPVPAGFHVVLPNVYIPFR